MHSVSWCLVPDARLGIDAYYEPEPHDRIWYRHVNTGDRGYLVKRAGKERIRYDRPAEDLHVPKDGKWKPDDEDKPFTLWQVAQIAFEADKKLCFFQGLHMESRREWESFTEEERYAYMHEGPDDDLLRAKLFAAIMAIMREHSK